MILFLWVLIIFCSGYYYSITTPGSYLGLVLLAVFILSYSFGMLVTKNSIKIEKRRFTMFCGLALCMIIPSLVRSSFSISEIRLLLILAVSLIITSIYKYDDFKKKYVIVMTWIAVLALLGLVITMSSMVGRFPIVTNYNGVNYISGGFFSVIKYEYSGISNRLQGIFWEPGLLATNLCIALFFAKEEYFKNRKRYHLGIALMVLCVVLSRTGAGIIMLALLLIIKTTSGKKLSPIKMILIFIIYVALIVVFVTDAFNTSEWLNNYLFSKLNNSSNISYSSRMEAFTLDFTLFFKYFPFGTGMSKYFSSIAEYSSALVSSGTSTLTTFLAEFGVFGIPYVVVWIKGIFKINNSKGIIPLIGSVLLFVFIISKEPHGTLLLMNCLMFFCYYDYSNVHTSFELENVGERSGNGQ